MRWYIDTEFDENGRTIDLISIALVSERDDVPDYYAVSSEFDPNACNEWVKANVLPKLPPRETWKPRSVIADEVRAILLHNGDKPEVWGYFADYDWVALCQLFGRMVDLPERMPFFCLDVRQAMHHAGVKRSELPPEPANAHDALADARWTKQAHELVMRAWP